MPTTPPAIRPNAAPEFEAGWSGNVLEWGHSVAIASSSLTHALNPINMLIDNSFPEVDVPRTEGMGWHGVVCATLP